MAENPAGGANAAKTMAAPPTCASCPFYLAPPTPPAGFDLGHDIAGRFRFGQCRRFPAFERREPGDWCGEHPDVRRLMERR